MSQATVVSEEDRKRIVDWFLEGQSINHIVYLLHYRYKIDAVSNVLRDKLKELLEDSQ